MKKLPVLAAGLLTGLLAGLGWWAVTDRDAPAIGLPGAPTLPADASAASPAPAPMPAPAVATALPALPLRLDSAGQLVIDADTALTLELLCHAPAAQASATVATLPASSRAQATALQGQYCSYLKASHEAGQTPPASLPDAQRQLDTLVALRRTFFDPATADRLFGTEEALAAHALAVAGLEQDPQLGAAEKAARIAALRRALPPAVSALETPTPAPEDLERLRAQAGDDSRQQLQRTAEIESQWSSRYQAYAAQKQPILSAGLADADKAALIEDLLRRHYAPGELAAARAYDRQHSPTASPAP